MSDDLVKPNMLPARSIHFLGGAPFAGKSTLIAMMIKSFTEGKSFLGGLEFEKLEPDQIGILLTDRPWSDNEVWINKLGIEGIQKFSIPDDKEMGTFLREVKGDPIYGITVFRECLKHFNLLRCRLLFVDVFTNVFLGNSIHDPAGVHRHMVNHQQLCQALDLTIVGTCYGSKQKKGKYEQMARPVDRVIGAAQLRGGASSLMFLTAPGETDESYQPFQWFSRLSGDRDFKLRRNSDTGLFEESFEESKAVVQQSHKGYEVLIYLTEPMSKGTLVKCLMTEGKSQATAYRSVNQAIASGWVHEAPDGTLSAGGGVG